ncbi:MAG: exodeoxyribonuclease VII large subunit [Gemmatimonadales bacterium]|nr:exodeoxyribonuclease VII large subunit [Gemmatimonadales bacterium]
MSSTEEAWTVARLASVLKRRVEEGFPATWVKGELVGVKRYPSGHWYFSLRDELAKVDCTMWKSAAQRLKVPLEEGTEVFLLGQPNLWEERTSLRFNVVQVIPAAAVGASAQAIERIKQALLADGLLDPGRKRPIPPFATRIAVVTSVAGAAVRDIITVANRRWPGVELFVVNAAVQGTTAPAEIVAALQMVARLPAIDCCIVGRGGGGKDDLAAFNDEAVCRAIAACPVPVISAVGHEVDVTLADLVADVRAATPSQAAEFVLPDRRDVAQRVFMLGSSLIGTATSLVELRKERLGRTRERLGTALLDRVRRSERRLVGVRGRLAPALTRRVALPQRLLTRLEGRLAPAIQRRAANARADLGRLAAMLDALSPLAVLGRGYAIPRDLDGRVLRRQAEFTPRTPFTLTVTDGTVPVRVEER